MNLSLVGKYADARISVRTRRIKCDETKPTCNQCAKSRRQCPGYKDEFDLVFRNETQATERRARRASRKVSVQKEDRQSLEEAGPSTGTVSVFSDSIRSPVEQTVAASLSLPVEQQANCYFVSNFVLMPKPGCNRGFLNYLVPLLKQDGKENHLQHAFNACSLALLNNRAGSGGKLGEKVFSEYSKALSGTNAALRDVEGQKADSTLAAVLLLGMFEVSYVHRILQTGNYPSRC